MLTFNFRTRSRINNRSFHRVATRDSSYQLRFWGGLLALVMVCAGTAFSQSPGPYATKIFLGTEAELSLYSSSMFRLRVSHLGGEKFPAKYEIPFVIGRTESWPKVEYRQWSEGDTDFVETSEIQIRVTQRDHSFTVWNPGGKAQIYPSDGPTYGIFRDGYTQFDSASALGQRTDYSRFSHWFYNSVTRRYVDTFLADDLIYDQFFLYGPSYEKLFHQINDLVGPAPMLPKKAYGFFQTQHLGCKGDQKQFMEVAEQLRKRHIPADTLVLDYEWGDGCPGGDQDDKYWGQFEWAQEYQSPLSPKNMIGNLRAMHFDVMLIHHNAPNFPHRAEAIERDRKREWTARVYDENEWWTKMRAQLDLGVRGTWQDTRKNDVTDSIIWNGLQDYYGDKQRVLFLGNRNMVEVDPWELARDDRWPSNSLLASRRYPFRWTGDAHMTWSELQWEIEAITNTHGAMAGVSYITADAYGADWKQQARWNQFLAFAPIARSHTMKPWEPSLKADALARIMAFGENKDSASASSSTATANMDGATDPSQPQPTAENSIRKNLALRYRLLPYVYSESYRHYKTGFPIVRPMVLAFPEDQHVKFNRWPYQYMLGPSFLVAPVWADLKTMEIYLPEGTTWIDYSNHREYAGGQTITYDTSDTTLLPLFVRAGSIIPMRRDAEWIDTSADDVLTLDIYPARQVSPFELYEDDGASTLYQAGQSSTTPLSAQLKENGDVTVTVGPTSGNYPGKPENRTYLLDVNAIANPPIQVARGEKPIKQKDNFASLDHAKEGWACDAKQHKVRVKIVQSASEGMTVLITNGIAH